MSHSNEAPELSRGSARTLKVLVHDLLVPLSALRASLEKVQHDLASRGITLSHSSLQHAIQYTNLIVQMMSNAEVIANVELDEAGRFSPQKTTLGKVVNSVLANLKLLTGSQLSGITFLGPEIKHFYVDEKSFRQLLFNFIWSWLRLDRKATIEIVTELVGSVKVTLRRLYPSSNVTPRATRNVDLSIALFVGEEIIRQHNGTITIVDTHDRTEVCLQFPETLLTPPVGSALK